jgi:hypothetical protein
MNVFTIHRDICIYIGLTAIFVLYLCFNYLIKYIAHNNFDFIGGSFLEIGLILMSLLCNMLFTAILIMLLLNWGRLSPNHWKKEIKIPLTYMVGFVERKE